MFCQACGTTMADVAVACPELPGGRAGPTARCRQDGRDTRRMGQRMGSLEAPWPVIRSDAYPRCTPHSARRRPCAFGLVYGAGSALLFVIGGYMLFAVPRRLALTSSVSPGVLKSRPLLPAPFGGTCAGSLAARKLFKAGGKSRRRRAHFPASPSCRSLSPCRLNGLLGYEHYGAIAGLSSSRVVPACSCSTRATCASAKLSERALVPRDPAGARPRLLARQSIAASILEGGPGAYSSSQPSVRRRFPTHPAPLRPHENSMNRALPPVDVPAPLQPPAPAAATTLPKDSRARTRPC